MAKYEKRFKGDFDVFKDYIYDRIINASSSVSYEDGSEVSIGDTRLAVQVFERYSMTGGNRVSLNLSIMAKDDEIFLSAIASGGSQAVFFKINTIGEETFLNECIEAVEDYL